MMESVRTVLVLALLSVAFGQEIPVPDFKDTDNEILKFEISNETKAAYPYYLSGYDDEGVPIWVSELGRWDTRKAADGTPQELRDYKINIIQMFKRCVNSENIQNNHEGPAHEFVLVFDMDGFNIRQTSSPSSLQLVLWIARQAEQAFSNNIKNAYIVNANYLFTTVFDLMKPILGRSVYKVEVFGTNKNVWTPKILKKLPKESLAEWGIIPHQNGVEENLTVDQVRGTFFEKVLNDRNSLGEFTFEKLWFRLDSYFGVTFFRWDQTYDLRYHIRSYDYHGRLAVPNPCEAPNLKRILRRLIHKRWWRRHSPWELLVIPNFRLQSDPDNFKTVLVLRFHPSLLNTEETQVLLGNLFGETFPESGWVRDRDLHWSTPFGNVLAVGSPLQAPLQLTDN
ncbi:unnamed protein product [Allacma fusca]|uniref:CRAL-TRIO domain-containing protein n=1 Tax=Allacma fusca TaxID=39272 RepID=A0A8J2KYJ1_9HEXA|nr:unnamed protein product [Allacma fusca]